MKKTLGQIIHGMVPDRDIQGTWINEPWEGEANQPAFEQTAQAVLAAAGVDAELVTLLSDWADREERKEFKKTICAILLRAKLNRIKIALRGEVMG